MAGRKPPPLIAVEIALSVVFWLGFLAYLLLILGASPFAQGGRFWAVFGLGSFVAVGLTQPIIGFFDIFYFMLTGHPYANESVNSIRRHLVYTLIALAILVSWVFVELDMIIRSFLG
ncbi:MAG: hypothetical protein LYZ66_06020 [Nitrososphaerales archaeon]|nr:hypothetical protein [Nitrososphaerales archaeon]